MVMTLKAEILAALQHMTQAERRQHLQMAAEAARADYLPGGALHDLWSADSEDYFEDREASIDAGVEINASR